MGNTCSSCQACSKEIISESTLLFMIKHSWKCYYKERKEKNREFNRFHKRSKKYK